MKGCCFWVHDLYKMKYKRKLQSFSANELLDFVATDISWPLLKTSFGNQYVVVMPNGYSKHKSAICTREKHIGAACSYTSQHSSANVEQLRFRTDYIGTQVIYKLLMKLCRFLKLKSWQQLPAFYQIAFRSSSIAARWPWYCVIRCPDIKAIGTHTYSCPHVPIPLMRIEVQNDLCKRCTTKRPA